MEDSINTSVTFDPFLLSVLQNTKNRETLKKLEETLNQFVKNESLQRLEFPPKTAFQRRIIHRVASRYQLDNILLAADNNSKSDKRGLVLIKTKNTQIPKLLLSELSGLEEKSVQQHTQPAKQAVQPPMETNSNVGSKPLFLKRNARDNTHRNFHRTWSSGGLESGGGTVIRGVTEEEYQKARARIFSGNGTNSKLGSSTSEGENELKKEERLETCDWKISCSEDTVERTVQENPPGVSSSPDALVDRELETENDVNDPDFDRSYSRWGATMPVVNTCQSEAGFLANPGYPATKPVHGNTVLVGNHTVNNYWGYHAQAEQNIPPAAFDSVFISPDNISHRPYEHHNSLYSECAGAQFPGSIIHCNYGNSPHFVSNISVEESANDSSSYLSMDPTSYVNEFPPLGRT
eukprot:jgi/Galph1/1817/GphlegSOOS_G495.1